MVLVMSILHALTSRDMQITHESMLIATVMKHMNNTVDYLVASSGMQSQSNHEIKAVLFVLVIIC